MAIEAPHGASAHELAAAPTGERDPPRRYFREKVWLTWAVLVVLLCGGCYELHLDFTYVALKLPFLLGIRLSPDGFIQGAVLTVFVTGVSMFFALSVALLTALGRLSKNPLAFAVATFYASLFRGTPLMVQVLIIYLALPPNRHRVGRFEFGSHCLVPQLWRIPRRNHSQRHHGGPSGATRGGDGARLAAVGDRMEGDRAASATPHHSTGRRAVRVDAEGLIIGLVDGLVGAQFSGAIVCPVYLPLHGMLIAAALIYWLLSIVFELIQFRLERRFGRGVAGLGRP